MAMGEPACVNAPVLESMANVERLSRSVSENFGFCC